MYGDFNYLDPDDVVMNWDKEYTLADYGLDGNYEVEEE